MKKRVVCHTGGQSEDLESEWVGRDGPVCSGVILLIEKRLVLMEALLPPGSKKKPVLRCGLREHSGSVIVAM